MITSTAPRTVGVGEFAVSTCDRERLVTYALGSCLGIAVHDPVAGVGGLLHVMLPDSNIDPVGAVQPGRYVDTGVPALFRECYRHGARKERMTVKVAGGAFSNRVFDNDPFQVGRRNLVALRRIFWRNGVLIHAEDVGGCLTVRTMSLFVGTGAVVLSVNGVPRPL